MKAALLIRTAVHYRHDAFKEGLRRLGYSVVDTADTDADVVVMWNRYGSRHLYASAMEERGAKILVAENGYLGKDYRGESWYALAGRHHNGAGDWPRALGNARIAAYGPQALPPYRAPPVPGSRRVLRGLLLPQRGIGPPGIASPIDWESRVRSAVRRSGLTVELAARQHPGANRATGDGLEAALSSVDFAIVWSSGAGVKSLVHGTPVVSTYADWIGAPAATSLDEFLQTGMLRTDEKIRAETLASVFAAMWRLDEIQSGEALQKVLESM